MHGIAWNHMVPCMELHGSLMNLDPGNATLYPCGSDKFFSLLSEKNQKEPISEHESLQDLVLTQMLEFPQIILQNKSK